MGRERSKRPADGGSRGQVHRPGGTNHPRRVAFVVSRYVEPYFTRHVRTHTHTHTYMTRPMAPVRSVWNRPVSHAKSTVEAVSRRTGGRTNLQQIYRLGSTGRSLHLRPGIDPVLEKGKHPGHLYRQTGAAFCSFSDGCTAFGSRDFSPCSQQPKGDQIGRHSTDRADRRYLCVIYVLHIYGKPIIPCYLQWSCAPNSMHQK